MLDAGFRLYENGEFGPSLVYFIKCIKRYPRCVVGSILTAATLYRLGYFLESDSLLTKALKFLPSTQNSSSLNITGDSVLDESREELRMVALFNRCLSRIGYGYDEIALDDIKELIKQYPQNHAFRSTFALILRRVGNFYKAEKEYLLLHALDMIEEEKKADLFKKQKKRRMMDVSQVEMRSNPLERSSSIISPSLSSQFDTSACLKSITGQLGVQQGQSISLISQTQPPIKDLSNPPLGSPILSLIPRPTSACSRINRPTSKVNRKRKGVVAFEHSESIIGKFSKQDSREFGKSSSFSTLNRKSHITYGSLESKEEKEESIYALDDATLFDLDEKAKIMAQEKLKNIKERIQKHNIQLDKESQEEEEEEKSSQSSSSSELCLDTLPPIEENPKFKKIFNEEMIRMGARDDGRNIGTSNKNLSLGTKMNQVQNRLIGEEAAKKASQSLVLHDYKKVIGFSQQDLHCSLFQRPSDFQSSLLTPPERRSQYQAEVIAKELNQFDILSSMNGEQLEDVAFSVEYRALQGVGAIFSQGRVASGCALVLSGEIEGRILSSTGEQKIVGKFGEGEWFGHLDFLFGEDYDDEELKQRGNPEWWNKHLMSYFVSKQAEILLFLYSSTHVFLRSPLETELQERLDCFMKSNLFHEWDEEDKTRFVRLSVRKRVLSGVTIVGQQTYPSNLIFLMKGVMKRTRFVDNQYEIKTAISNKRDELNKLKEKFSFHHTLGDVYERDLKGREGKPPNWSHVHFTEGERLIARTEEELDELCKRECMLDISPPSSSQERKENAAVEIGIILPPSFFGEESLLSLQGMGDGLANTSVISDTTVSLLQIHPLLCRSFKDSASLVSSLSLRAFKIPEGSALAQKQSSQAQWSRVKRKLINDLDKSKWPKDSENFEEKEKQAIKYFEMI